jgi:citrate synthase
LLTGDVLIKVEAEEVVGELKTQTAVPQYVFDVLQTIPRDTHPMTMLSTAILYLQQNSIYVKRYNKKLGKNDH